MNTISACMIIKNEEDKIYDTLHSICDVFDQIVVVDTGSTDNTLFEVQKFIIEIKPKSSIHIEHFEWCNDFSAARNYSYQFANSDYVTWWDADDRMTPELKNFLVFFKQSHQNFDVVKIPTVLSIKEGEIEKQVINDRIIKRSLNPYWVYRIHEQIMYKQDRHLEVLSTVLYQGVFVDAIKDYSNTHHYDFYVNLINEGHHFTLHDYFFFFNEMINTNNFRLWDWYKYNLLECLEEQTEYPSYAMMIYQTAKSLPEFFMGPFEMLKLPIIHQQLRYHDAEPIALFELAKYYYDKGKSEMAKILFKGVVETNATNDYDNRTGEKLKVVAKEMLKSL